MKSILFLIMVFALHFATTTLAADFCVDSSSELQAALAIAEGNNQSNHIRVKVGSYPTSGSRFSYDAQHGQDLKVTGGWISHQGIECGIQSLNHPMQTIIDGEGNTGGLVVTLPQSASLEVTHLAFLNANSNEEGGGLRVMYQGNFSNTSTLTIANNAFLNNQGSIGSAFYATGPNTLHIRNNLVSNNDTTGSYAAFVLAPHIGSGLYFTNNTVVNNTSTNPSESGGVYLYARENAKLLIANNTVNGNQIEDLHALNSAGYYLYNNNIDQLVGDVPDYFANNFNLPNRFESGFLNFVPAADSPLVDAGRSPCGFVCPFPTPFEFNWLLSETDLQDMERIQANAVDIGAFESSHSRDLIFWGTFE